MSAETFTTDVPAPAAPTAASRLAELNLPLDRGVRYRLESVFPKVAGFGWKGAVKKKHALIRRIEPVLRAALAPHESVLYVAKGTQYSFAEQYFMGALWAATINQTVFVLTDARIVMLRTNSKGDPKPTCWSIYYSQIERFKAGWTGVVQLKLRDSKKLKFTSFPRADRAAMPGLFERTVAAFREHGFDPAVSQSMENLCSYCFGRVPKGEHDCPACGATFWSPAAVAWRSLVLPSWGDLCMGHYLLAAVEMIGTVFAWTLAAAGVREAIKSGDPGGFLAAGLIVVVAHCVDAMVTYAVAKKGLHPRRPPLPEGAEAVPA